MSDEDFKMRGKRKHKGEAAEAALFKWPSEPKNELRPLICLPCPYLPYVPASLSRDALPRLNLMPDHYSNRIMADSKVQLILEK
jgi:hypothetical protein